MTLRQRWHAAARLIADSRDLLDERPWGGEPTRSLETRGWATALLELRDEEVATLEIDGLEADWPAGAPSSLTELRQRVRDACKVASLAPSIEGRPSRRRETERKRAQVEAFARILQPLAARASRVVDVGAGHGHLTREIAARVPCPVLGLERDDAITRRARELPSTGAASFAVTDVLRDGLPLVAGDCVIALHACGELGDEIVRSAARARISVALVSCCLQKQRAARRAPLCEAGDMGASLDLPRRLLGLSNLTAREDGVEASRAENLRGRERRLALHRLLTAHEPALPFGAEIDGLNRRAAREDLPILVRRAFALRGLPEASAAATEDAMAWARIYHPRARRLSLPRSMLARALEVFVLLDRALFLEERGHQVRVGTLFSPEVSARNLALVASCDVASGASEPAAE